MPITMLHATRLAVYLFLALPAAAQAQSVGANAIVDFGTVLPSNQQSFEKGGLGKLEFGGGSPLPFGQALADLRADFGHSVDAFATVRVAPGLHAPFDVLEAYARYKPVVSRTWNATVKGGAFFPPISLENEGIGWTSPWTETSSAINSWVGDELRTIGAEASAEWRYRSGSLGLVGAIFGANDPAGAALADRGWVFDSRPSGLFGEPRLPDVLARQLSRPAPIREEPFKEIDGRPGWYAGVSARRDGFGRIAALYYDNEADPGAHSGGDFGWRTKFASLGAEIDIGDVVVLTQGMFGQTAIKPVEGFYSTTHFQSAYVLAGYYFGNYRVAGRVDAFATQLDNRPGGSGPGEHGFALTLAGTWEPLRWLRISTELLRVDSERGERASLGLPIRSIELQGLLVTRLLF